MTATPGTPDDWTDTNPESTAPERILPTPEDVTPSATKVAMVCYAVGAASKCWEHPERAGVFDSDRASQIVTELCVALGMEQQGDTAPESARAATLTPEQPVKAPGQGGDLLLTRGKPVEVEWPNGYRLLRYVDEGGYQRFAGEVGNGRPHPWGESRIVRVLTEEKPAQEPVLPRRIAPEDVRVGMVVERRKGEHYVGGRVKNADGFCSILLDASDVVWAYGVYYAKHGWSLWLIEDAPAPVDPDAAAIEAIVTAYRSSPECSTHSVFGEAMLDHLRAQGFDVTPRAEQ